MPKCFNSNSLREHSVWCRIGIYKTHNIKHMRFKLNCPRCQGALVQRWSSFRICHQPVEDDKMEVVMGKICCSFVWRDGNMYSHVCVNAIRLSVTSHDLHPALYLSLQIHRVLTCSVHSGTVRVGIDCNKNRLDQHLGLLFFSHDLFFGHNTKTHPNPERDVFTCHDQ